MGTPPRRLRTKSSAIQRLQLTACADYATVRPLVDAALADRTAPSRPVAMALRRALAEPARVLRVVILVAVPFAFSEVPASRRAPSHPRPGAVVRGRLGRPPTACGSAPGRGAGSPDRAAVVIVHGLGDSPGELRRSRRRAAPPRPHRAPPRPPRPRRQRGPVHDPRRPRARRRARGHGRPARAPARPGRACVLMGHSMGAVAVLRAAAGQPDVRAVIVEAPYDTYRANVSHHARLLYRLPSWVPIIPITIAIAEWRAGFRRRRGGRGGRGARARRRRCWRSSTARTPGCRRRWCAAWPMPTPGRSRSGWLPAPNTSAPCCDPDYWRVVLSFLDGAGV